MKATRQLGLRPPAPPQTPLVLPPILYSFLGMALLLGLCLLERLAVGLDPWMLAGAVVPICFGGVVGYLWGRRVKQLTWLRHELRQRIHETEHPLPICSCCKKIRIEPIDHFDPLEWVDVDSYFHDFDQVQFSHSLCPLCAEKMGMEFRPSLSDSVGRRERDPAAPTLQLSRYHPANGTA